MEMSQYYFILGRSDPYYGYDDCFMVTRSGEGLQSFMSEYTVKHDITGIITKNTIAVDVYVRLIKSGQSELGWNVLVDQKEGRVTIRRRQKDGKAIRTEVIEGSLDEFIDPYQFDDVSDE